ncbi:hypothetical protein [Selenihalanaerobacter shriftii]|uniref:Uncharacterized protein n=1 Tax=Selenihalanaerobacter shriftii TaxID=142842 RepID=A0A1T4L1E0_9FIRM|nr:hypothetical protein [Selenihalanaerobacter shriftii]SJZ48552.1 hypothetical protein SAMN02745118_00992 [Selenihalanaerobacter shriftii]
MLIDYKATLALRCPICGEIGLHSFTIFDFSGGENLQIECECGFNKMVIGTNNYKQYWLQFACVICEVEHITFYKGNELWSSDIKEISCLENEIELGYLGLADKVKKTIEEEEKELESVLDEVGFENYFSSPEIMLSALNLLHDIAETGGLSCQCGNDDIDIDMFPGKIELLCNQCDGLTTINAETKADLNFLKNIKKIEMLEGVVSALEKRN